MIACLIPALFTSIIILHLPKCLTGITTSGGAGFLTDFSISAMLNKMPSPPKLNTTGIQNEFDKIKDRLNVLEKWKTTIGSGTNSGSTTNNNNNDDDGSNTDISGLTNRLDALETKLKELQTEREQAVSTSIKGVNEAIERIKEDTDALSEKLNTAVDENKSEVESMIDSVQETIEANQNDLLEEISKLKAAKKEQESNIQRLESTASTMESTLSGYKAQIEALQTKVEKLTNTVSAEKKQVTARLDGHDKDIHELRYGKEMVSTGTCPEGFTTNYNNNKCYYFSAGRVSWLDAVEMCKLIDSRLLIIEDDAEDNWIKDQIRYHGKTYYMGAHDFPVRNKYRWWNGKPVENYKWRWGEPNNVDENCLGYYGGAWGDLGCSEYYFICKRPK